MYRRHPPAAPAAPAVDHDRQFGLVVDRIGPRRQHDLIAMTDEAGGRFHEDDRRFWQRTTG
jgi:hypothetical protein